MCLVKARPYFIRFYHQPKNTEASSGFYVDSSWLAHGTTLNIPWSFPSAKEHIGRLANARAAFLSQIQQLEIDLKAPKPSPPPTGQICQTRLPWTLSIPKSLQGLTSFLNALPGLSRSSAVWPLVTAFKNRRVQAAKNSRRATLPSCFSGPPLGEVLPLASIPSPSVPVHPNVKLSAFPETTYKLHGTLRIQEVSAVSAKESKTAWRRNSEHVRNIPCRRHTSANDHLHSWNGGFNWL